MKTNHVLVLSIITILFGIASNAESMIQVVNALSDSLYFHFKGLAIPFGNDAKITLTGSKGQTHTWRMHLYPIINDNVDLRLNPKYFKNGELATACVIDTSSARSLKACSRVQLDLNDGTDIYLNVPALPRLGWK